MSKNKKVRHNSRNKGFSLIEVLIAIAIFVAVTVPLAMNLISTSQINTKSKNTSTASNLSATMLESMQSVKLSDLLIEMNGYNTNEYGENLAYSLVNSSLHGYKVGRVFEAISETNGGTRYVPVKKQEDVSLDALVQGSIRTRTTIEGIVKAYFVGQKDDNYSVVLRDVHNDEASFDIVVDIEKGQEFSLANINAMNQSNVVNIFEKANMDNTVAEYFVGLNETARSTDSSIPAYSAQQFKDAFVKNYTITIQQDVITEATNIIMDCVYVVPEGSVGNQSEQYKVNLGRFSTNSTSEFAAGVYLYYYPLANSGSTRRNNFTINNKNELSTSVYLVAVGDVAKADGFLAQYTPSITVNELSDTVYSESARTTICSNIPDENWNPKTLTPPRPNALTIKTLANITDSQTLYTVSIKVYAHSAAAFDSNGVFTPSDKNLLIETNGSFLDNSIKYDIDSDKTTGLTTVDGYAEVIIQSVTYNGTEQSGLRPVNATLTGQVVAVDAGEYIAMAEPVRGCVWADGGNEPRPYRWKIKRSPTATVSYENKQYDTTTQTGVTGENVSFSGRVYGKEIGYYTAYATPDPNYAWDDGTFQTKTIEWKITPKEVTLVWETGEGKDLWVYDGETHRAVCKVTGLLGTDRCEPILVDYTIRNVGYKIAKVTGLSNSNYVLPALNREHRIEVVPQSAAFVTVNNHTYDGTMKEGVTSSQGVSLAGTTQATEAGQYTIIASVMPGFTWSDGTTDTKTYEWSISKIQTKITWGTTTWVYDGFEHSTTCLVTDTNGNPINGLTVKLANNKITNVGTQQVSIISLSNPNYTLPSNSTTTLTVTRCPTASYEVENFDYDGAYHFGVVNYTDVTLSEITDPQVEANIYQTTITPKSNYAWSDGTYAPKTVHWNIYYIRDAWVEGSDVPYTPNVGSNTPAVVRGVIGENVDFTGVTAAQNIGEYVAHASPIPNHAWADTGTTEIRHIVWHITAATMNRPTFYFDTNIIPNNELQNGGDKFIYDGTTRVVKMSFLWGTISLNDTETLAALGYKVESGSQISAKNAGNYTFSIGLTDTTGTGWGDGNVSPVSYTWSINKRPINITYPTITKTFDRQSILATDITSQVTVKPNALLGYDADGNGHLEESEYLPALAEGDSIYSQTVKYYKEDGTTELGSAPMNAGVYKFSVELKIHNQNGEDVTSNYNINYPEKGTITIHKAAIKAEEFTAPTKINNLVYNGTAQTLINLGQWTGNSCGTFQYSVDSSSFSTNTPKGTSAKNNVAYVVQWKIIGDENHSDYDGGTINVTINKANQTVTAPTPKNLTYNGNDQVLANPGSSNSGLTLLYNTVGGNIYDAGWGGSIPNGKNAGSYTIFYCVRGDENWNDFAAKTVVCTINKATPTITLTANYSETCAGRVVKITGTSSISANISLSSNNGGTFTNTTISSGNSTNFTAGGSARTVIITATTAATDNYAQGSKTVTVTVKAHPTTTGGSLASSATCTQPAQYYHKCSWCGQQLTSTYSSGSALGHNFTSQTQTSTYLKANATCQHAKQYYYKCSRCSESSKNHTGTYYSVGSTTSHTWGSWKASGDNYVWKGISTGYQCSHTHTCTVCGTNSTSGSEQNSGDGKITVHPTTLSYGTGHSVCCQTCNRGIKYFYCFGNSSGGGQTSHYCLACGQLIDILTQ